MGGIIIIAISLIVGNKIRPAEVTRCTGAIDLVVT
jgi:hypothetical protein